MSSIDRGEVDLAEWLGLEQQLQTPWANDRPRTVSESELHTLIGKPRPGLLADLVRFQLIERRGDMHLLESPALLGVAMKLEAAGVELGIARAAAEIVRKHMERAPSELIEMFMKRVREAELGVEPAKLLEALRPLGLEAVRIIFGRVMESGLRKLVESGALAKLRRKTRRRQRK